MQKLTLLILFVVAIMTQAEDKKPQYDLTDGPALFAKFIKDFNKVYEDEADKEVHYQEFLKSLEVLNKVNAAISGVVLEINAFADYTPEQRKNLEGLTFNQRRVVSQAQRALHIPGIDKFPLLVNTLRLSSFCFTTKTTAEEDKSGKGCLTRKLALKKYPARMYFKI
ncbi:uncharacterized protein LOC112053580 [Bicyclus anynana]|uniref:Uncharacterized protein LOC112053580 n=1 Tax=Bicyclus anynana TaxID=110368 RepID=A0A6J1NVK5_BICAN|nr:uncharacterized protein LOC112053580 [Bicyclus anynana]